MVQSFKSSKSGRLKLVSDEGEFRTVRADDVPEKDDELITVFENGEIKKEYTFEEIRDRAAKRTLIHA